MRSTSFLLVFVGLSSLGCGGGGADGAGGLVDGPDAESDGGAGADARPDAPTAADAEGGAPATATKWKTVSLGGGHACALTVDGKAYCWGYRADGNCGDGMTSTTQLDWSKPHAVAGDLTFSKISAGVGYHTCAIDTAKKLYCWGANHRGQVGDGGPTKGTTAEPDAALRFSPVPILPGTTFADVSAGAEHTCAVDTSGKVYCWGANGDYQAGNDAFHLDAVVPTEVTGTGALSFAKVSAGHRHTCALTTDGAGWCWGNRDSGALGDGQPWNLGATSSPVLVAGSLAWSRIAAGGTHTCGIEKGTGDVYCWGVNQSAALGVEAVNDPSNVNDTRSAPVKTASGFKATDVTVLNGNTCAIDPSGDAFCWGMNASSGVIADGEEFSSGTTTYSPEPQLVVGGHRFANISGNASMVCATTTDGDIYCWGDATSARFRFAEHAARNATPQKLPEPD